MKTGKDGHQGSAPVQISFTTLQGVIDAVDIYATIDKVSRSRFIHDALMQVTFDRMINDGSLATKCRSADDASNT